jgi:Mn2+/Fe2+ NRAMP family transporter
VAYFIILTTGATLFVAGKTDITSATDAAQALRPLAGDAARSCSRSGSSGPAC